MMVRGQFYQLMAKGLHGLFVHFLDLKQRVEEYSHIANIETSDAAFEDEAEFSGLGPMQPKPEGGAYVYQDIVAGGTIRAIHQPWGLGIRASHELIKDDQYKLINQAPKCLARSAHFVREIQFWNLFALGFSTVTTIDGLALFHTSHPLLGGPTATDIAPGVSTVISASGTYPNKFVTDVDLSQTALQSAIDIYERMPDSQGMPISIRAKHLVITPEQKWIAREILGSPHKPYTADNEINALVGEDLTYFVTHYIPSHTQWFLVPEKENHKLKFINREMLEEDFSDDFDTKSIKQVAYQRFSVLAGHWIGVFGSDGP